MVWKKLFFILAAALLLAGCMHAGKTATTGQALSEELPGEETEEQEELLEAAIDEEALIEEDELPEEEFE